MEPKKVREFELTLPDGTRQLWIEIDDTFEIPMRFEILSRWEVEERRKTNKRCKAS